MRLKYILCVDDESMNLDLIEAFLEDEFEIKLVCDGYACLASVAERKPDLILLDVMMPGMDGREVCNNIKSNPDTKNIPIVYVTGMADLNNLEELKSDPADALLSKPFSRTQLLDTIKNYLPLGKIVSTEK